MRTGPGDRDLGGAGGVGAALVTRWRTAAGGVVLLASLVAVLRHVGHDGLSYWDEAFHAIVARNLTKHPLTFTLYDQPWLPYDFRNWESAHIWLHKPPVAMWQIFLSYSALGVNAFALRLPSVVAATLAVWLTYRIAADLYGERVGLVAAFAQGFNPFLYAFVHGYQYSDHVDVALLFWVQLACWLLLRALRTGAWGLYALSGIAMGIAWLAKSYPALVTFGIAGAAWLARRAGALDLDGDRIRLRHLAIQLGTAVLTVAPWVAYCLVRHPAEFTYEHGLVLDHLRADVEGWGATWDRHLFDYMIRFFPAIYVAVLAAAVGLAWLMVRGRRLEEFFVVAWAAGVVVPLTLATTKTPSATMIAVPPLLIALAAMIGGAWRRDDRVCTAVWFASMLAITLVEGGRSRVTRRDEFADVQRAAPFLEANVWVIGQMVALVLVLAALVLLHRLLRRSRWCGGTWWGLRLAALLLTLVHATGYVDAALRVTRSNRGASLYVALGERLRRELPQNACLFLDDPILGSHLTLMYYADRSTYDVQPRRRTPPRDVPEDARRAREAGARPYLVSVNGASHDYPLVMQGEVPAGRGRTQTYRVYEVIEPRAR